MADLEKRVEVLEREMAIVKVRTGRHDEELTNIRKAQLAERVTDANIDAELQHAKCMRKLSKSIAYAVREVFNERDRLKK